MYRLLHSLRSVEVTGKIKVTCYFGQSDKFHGRKDHVIHCKFNKNLIE